MLKRKFFEPSNLNEDELTYDKKFFFVKKTKYAKPFPDCPLFSNFCFSLIFNYFDQSEILSYRTVNRNWNSLIKINIRSLTLGGNHIEECLELFPNINDLTLIVSPEDLQLAKYSQIQKLNMVQFTPQYILLKDTKIPDLIWTGNYSCVNDCLSGLLFFISNTNHVKSLTLNEVPGYCEICLFYYPKLLSLRSLIFNSCFDMNFNQIELLTHLPNLEHLSILNCDFVNYILINNILVDTIFLMKSLKTLELTDDLLSPYQLKRLLNKPNLKVKIIPSNFNSDDDAVSAKFQINNSYGSNYSFDSNDNNDLDYPEELSYSSDYQ